jgi:hypothetical protein
VEQTAISDLVDGLDQSTSSLIVIEPPTGESVLLVGGGLGQYVVTYVEPDQRSAVVVDRSADPDIEIRVVAGGQAGNYPARWVVSRATAVQAATAFSQTGSRAAELLWEWA